MSAVRLPDAVLAMAARGAEWERWVLGLRAAVADVLSEWELDPVGEVLHGHASVVLSVVTAGGAAAVLKLGFPDDESEHEHLALQRWGGRGAVTLLRADPRRRAMLLERLAPGGLDERWDVEACEVVAGLYARLHQPAPPQLRPLTAYVERWTDGLAALPRSAPVPHRLVAQAISLGRAFVDDPSSTGVLVHTDLHGGNVMLRRPGEWVAIDPKPVSGDPHYEPGPMLWNRFDEVAGDVRDGLRRRFHALVDVAGLDEDRARDWVVVRTLHQALWQLQDDAASRSDTRDVLTRCVAVAKAVQE